MKDKNLRIAIMSVADSLNYGDALFPFVLESEILKYYPNTECRFFTPQNATIEGKNFFEYSKDDIDDFAPDAIIAIDGETIHKHDNTLWKKIYEHTYGKIWKQKPSNLFFAWLDRNDTYKVWLSTGALDGNNPDEYATESEIEKLDFCSTRGLINKKILERKQLIYFNPKIQITPDIGWLFPRYFSNYNEILIEINKKNNIELKENEFICFSLNFWFQDKEKIERINEALTQFAQRTKCKIVVMPQHLNNQEQELTHLNPSFIYLKDLNLYQMGALLSACKFYIGYAMHFAITALSNAKPAAIIHHRQMTKTQDLFGHLMRVDLLSSNLNDFEKLLYKLNSFSSEEKEILKAYTNFMQKTFDFRLKTLLNKIIKYKNTRRGGGTTD